MSAFSVVVASQDSGSTILQCLASLERQVRGEDVEIIVVENSGNETAQAIRAQFPHVRVLHEDRRQLVPHLWAKGALQASGAVIAFTTGDCIPDPDWVSAMRDLHSKPLPGHDGLAPAAVGGALEIAHPASLTRWAIYFCRYAAFMPPLAAARSAQIPGDNSAYRRWVIARYARFIEGGFWESLINDQLRREGHGLLLSPAPRVTYAGSTGMLEFCRQRIAHARVFGAARARAASPLRRVRLLLLAPLVPAVLLARMARHILRRRRHVAKFVQAFPLCALFVICWSWGEFTGLLKGSLWRWTEPMGIGAPQTGSPGSD